VDIRNEGPSAMRDADQTKPPPGLGDPAPEAQTRAFLRMASHELRTPLNSIIGFSEIIATELYGPLGAPQYKEYAEIIRESGNKLLKLVNQVLEIARLESRAVEWDLEIEPLGPAIDGVFSGLAREMAERDVKVTVATETLPSVVADARGLQTILAGLLQNAVLHSPTGSEVEICAARKGAVVELSIENPAGDLDPAEIPRLMKPFAQGETALTRPEGAGLGLSICALTCQAMGGDLTVSPAPGGRFRAAVSLKAA
jgi:signal transduction histidine kinase